MNARNKVQRLLYGECAVILYHRVIDLETDPQQLAVSVENFNMQLDLLKNNYYVITPSEFTACILNEKKFPPRSVLITFDDGYHDNYLNAIPALEKRNQSALFYITTGNIDTDREFWWDEVERAILLGTLNQSNSLYEQSLSKFRTMKPAERDENIKKMINASNAKISRSSYRSITSAELKLLSQSPAVTVGGHTVNHSSLASLNTEEQRKEILDSKNYIEQQIGFEIKHFSYPFGTKKDFNETTKNICSEIGFDIVCANYPEMTTPKSDRYEIPRFLVRNWNESEFSSFMNNIFS